MAEDDDRIEAIRISLEPFLQGGNTSNRLEGLPEFVKLDLLAYSIASSIGDYEALVDRLPLSELVKFVLYRCING